MTPVKTYLWGNGSQGYDECERWVSSYERNVWVTFGWARKPELGCDLQIPSLAQASFSCRAPIPSSASSLEADEALEGGVQVWCLMGVRAKEHGWKMQTNSCPEVSPLLTRPVWVSQKVLHVQSLRFTSLVPSLWLEIRSHRVRISWAFGCIAFMWKLGECIWRFP